MLRRALQYQKLVGLPLALHEEDPSLSLDGVMHEGEVSALLGMAGIPSVSESTLVARDAALAGYEDGRVHFQHLSAIESVEALRAAKAEGIRATGEASPHHLVLTHEAVRSLSTEREDEPAAALRGRPPGADRRPAATGRSTASPPTTPRTRATRRRCPSRRRRWGRPAWRPRSPRSSPTSSCPVSLTLELVVDKLSAGAATLDLPLPRIAAGAPADLALLDLDATWEVGAEGYASRAENCCFHGRTLQGRVEATIAAGSLVFARDRAAAGVGVMSHPSLLDRDRAALVVVDVQEAFRPAVEAFEGTAGRVAVLVRGARELGVPVHVTEQYPKGLGRTVPEVADALGDDADVEKTVFSACRAEGFDLDGRDQAIVCGIETHVCVSQTVHDLLDQGVQVHVAVDAVSSRASADKQVGLDKMERAGALPSSVETALLELVGAAGSDEFKAIQGLIK